MKPILYTDTATDFRSNGIGILNDAKTAKVVQELNGEYELTLKYPDTGIHAEHIADRCIILAKPDPVTAPQPFRIYRINPVSNGTITVYARHIAYDTMGIPVVPFSASSAAGALERMKANTAVGCPFTFSTDKDTAAELNADIPKSVWKTLGGSEGSILDVYGGEYEFDGFNIHLHNRRGTDRGVSIRYGKNLKTLAQDRNCAECYTAVYPYWKGYNGTLIQLPEKIINAEGTYNYVRVLTLDLSMEWEEAPTEDQLRARTEKYIAENNIGVPEVSWKVEFVQLEQTEEYKGTALLERVLLGDTVTVVFPRMNVYASARAVKIDFDPILERYNSVTLGRVKSNLADTIVKQEQSIAQIQNPSAWQNAVERATQWITGGKGYMVAVRDESGIWTELCSLDTPDINSAVNVWRWNNGGLGFSSNGYNGPFKFAITQDGHIVADFISTGTLDASLLKTGVITSADGSVQLDLSNNKVVVQTLINSMKGKVEISSDGIYGYGYDTSTGEYYKTLRLAPGSKTSDSQESLTAITSADSTGGIVVCAATKDGISRLGQALSPTAIVGSEISIAYKTVSWKNNGDGTFTLIGT